MRFRSSPVVARVRRALSTDRALELIYADRDRRRAASVDADIAQTFTAADVERLRRDGT